MAKVQANYDTETKQLTLSIDGVDQPMVEYICFENFNDEYSGFNASFKTVDQNGIKYRLSAYGSEIEKSNPIEDYIRENLTKNKK